jgi:hypothetical protein
MIGNIAVALVALIGVVWVAWIAGCVLMDIAAKLMGDD